MSALLSTNHHVLQEPSWNVLHWFSPSCDCPTQGSPSPDLDQLQTGFSAPSLFLSSTSSNTSKVIQLKAYLILWSQHIGSSPKSHDSPVVRPSYFWSLPSLQFDLLPPYLGLYVLPLSLVQILAGARLFLTPESAHADPSRWKTPFLILLLIPAYFKCSSGRISSNTLLLTLKLL